MQLRDYQQHAVDAAIAHFKQSTDSAVLVLPTGAGKSIVIAELARIAKGRVLVLTHVKELVEQNAEKIGLLTDKAGIYSAGLKQKSTQEKTIVASIQSAVKQPLRFDQPYSLVIIDECHRVSQDKDSQYQQLLQHLKQVNPKIRLLGLTATPYRLETGWIFRHHYHGKVGNTDSPVFEKCIYELPMRPLIKRGFLSQPKMYDGLSAQYDFSQIPVSDSGHYPEKQINDLLSHSGRATVAIVEQIIELGQQKQGIIIFAATVRHAQEVMSVLDSPQAGLITATTSHDDRDAIINQFKAKQLKYLVNVAVLTTGFDAPHVDLIAILRPTASVSLFQQMVGRGLRVDTDKHDCLVIDYAANGFDLFYPEVGQLKPNTKSVPVQVPCPSCQFANIFWGIVDDDGDIVEHYGRRCQGLIETQGTSIQCDFRFRAKPCPSCGELNDIAAKVCHACDATIIDADKRLKEVLQQRHHHLFKCQDMLLQVENERLTVKYIDFDGNDFTDRYRFETAAQRRAFYAVFVMSHTKTPGVKHPPINTATDAVNCANNFRKPDMLLLKKTTKGWDLVERFFDYKGRFQTEHKFL
ncbi:DEAD/DEAH box helicase [Shewanella sp. Scap07]|uniref:DEAD/DEAH box helicase n=1 Tax=Shewanella sp. Scap07 TaxID=2589987 RepID=UPI0015BFEB19|nr:DEAD/DEAH box helicase [Shewanella sp. Scap07]QLE85199.1 DEAD/DEAH box helicase [Shewanella sp. Scap07]